ncbi:sialoglycan-binding domain-containing protein, partial [Streptococcus pluranimalium]
MNQKSCNKRQRFSIRKYHFGAASVLLGALLLLGQGTVSASENTASNAEVAPVSLSQGDSASGETQMASKDTEESANQHLQVPSVELQSPTTVSVDADNNGHRGVAEETVDLAEKNPASTPEDLDGDGFPNTVEEAAGSDPNDPSSTPETVDSDGDGFPDKAEEAAGSNPKDKNSTPEDLDGDGFPNTVEEAAGSDPNDPSSTPDAVDSDGDGFSNDAEDAAGSDKNDATPSSDRLVSDVSDLESLDTKTPTSLYTTRSAADVYESRSIEELLKGRETVVTYNDREDNISGGVGNYNIIQDDVVFRFINRGDNTFYAEITMKLKVPANKGRYQNIAFGFRADQNDKKPDNVIIKKDGTPVSIVGNPWGPVRVRGVSDGDIRVYGYTVDKSPDVENNYEVTLKYENLDFENLELWGATVSTENIQQTIGSNKKDGVLNLTKIYMHDRFGSKLFLHMKDEDVPLHNTHTIEWKTSSVDGRHDIGFQYSPDKKSIVYYFDIDDPTRFTENDLLKTLTAKLNPGFPNDGYLLRNQDGQEKVYVENNEQGFSKLNNINYQKDGKDVPILDLIHFKETGWGGNAINVSNTQTGAQIRVEAANGAEAFDIKASDPRISELVTSSFERHQLFNTKQTVTNAYDWNARQTTSNVVNVYTVGYKTDDQRPVVTGNKEVIVYRGEHFEDTSMTVTDNSGKIVSLSTDRGGVLSGSPLSWLKISEENLNVAGNATVTKPYTVKLYGEVPTDVTLDSKGEARFTHYLTAVDEAGNQSTKKRRDAGSPGEFVVIIKEQKEKYEPQLTDENPVEIPVGTPVDTQAILDKVTVPNKSKDELTMEVTKRPDVNNLGEDTATVTVTYPDKSTDTIEVPVNVGDDQRPVVTGNKEVIVYRGESFEDTSMTVTDNSGKIVSLSTDRGGVLSGSPLSWLKISEENLN